MASFEEMQRLCKLRKWRDELQEARFRGIRRVRDQSGEEVEYKSDAEMAAALAAVEAAISGASQPHPKTVYLRTSKGI